MGMDCYTGQSPGIGSSVAAQALRLVLLRITRVRVRCAMPLSQAQVDILKTPTTVIEIQGQNPKKTVSKSFERFDRYKSATYHIGDANKPKDQTGRTCRQTLRKVT